MDQELARRSGDEIFDLTQFLLGRSSAWGAFVDRRGKVRRRFTVDIVGRWDGDEFVLEESFKNCDGSHELREWRIVPTSHGRFKARADGVIGEAVGTADADGVRIRYAFDLPVGQRKIVVDFDDLIVSVDRRTAVNRAIVRKWGFKLGEVLLTFRREGAERDEVQQLDNARQGAFRPRVVA